MMHGESCRSYAKQISLLVSGDLPAAAAEATRRHLSGCASCQAEEAGQRAVMIELRALRRDLCAAAASESRIWAEMAREVRLRRGPTDEPSTWLALLPAALVAAALAVVLLDLQGLWRGSDEPAGRAEQAREDEQRRRSTARDMRDAPLDVAVWEEEALYLDLDPPGFIDELCAEDLEQLSELFGKRGA